jgi:GTP-binding protein Era
MSKTHKSSFVNIIGHPNVGKSTLANALVGKRLSIITPKAQTTRHRIFGILNGETENFDYQLVFSDTPGVLIPAYALQESMLDAVHSSKDDADVFLYVVELGEGPLKHEGLYKHLQTTDVPVLLLLNKVDLHDQETLENESTLWAERLPKAEIIPMSAKTGFNLSYVLKRLLELSSEGPAYFDKDQLTDRSDRFICSEFIREQVLNRYKKEVPYSVEVDVDSFKDEPKILRIRAILVVARESQKGILIGHKGVALKAVGTAARRQLELFYGKQVYLELFVKVNSNWRNDPEKLKRYGY